MIVQQILNSKSEGRAGAAAAVVTIAPDATVAQVAECLALNRIGAVVVSPDGRRVAGIVSERDIVREVARRGAACLGDRADRIMTREIVTCTPDDSADTVLERMTVGRFRHLPVMADGAMVGLISIGDVVKARLSELSMEKAALEGMIMGY
jgi:CBS domain-containing protein